jgi:hypothetical protein
VITVVDSFDCAQEIAHPEIESMNFYPVAKNWSKKISPHLDNPVLQRVLAWNFNKYTVGCLGKRHTVKLMLSRKPLSNSAIILFDFAAKLQRRSQGCQRAL